MDFEWILLHTHALTWERQWTMDKETRQGARGVQFGLNYEIVCGTVAIYGTIAVWQFGSNYGILCVTVAGALCCRRTLLIMIIIYINNNIKIIIIIIIMAMMRMLMPRLTLVRPGGCTVGWPCSKGTTPAIMMVMMIMMMVMIMIAMMRVIKRMRMMTIKLMTVIEIIMLVSRPQDCHHHYHHRNLSTISLY